jgi:hypothetical protein
MCGSTGEQARTRTNRRLRLGKAIATLTPENATPKLENPPFGLVDTRLRASSFACAQAFDHYRQMVVYLRMNGIVPPASRGK